MAVQNRRHFGHHEFALTVGLLPLDAFTKGVTFSGSYTIHFTPLIGWEVGHFTHSVHYDTSLKDELRTLGIDPTLFEVVNQNLMTNFVFKPMYWKSAVLNDSIVHGEFFLLAGGGVGWFTRSTRPGFDVGVGARTYLSDLFSIRLDIRYLLFIEGGDISIHDELWLGLGLALTL